MMSFTPSRSNAINKILNAATKGYFLPNSDLCKYPTTFKEFFEAARSRIQLVIVDQLNYQNWILQNKKALDLAVESILSQMNDLFINLTGESFEDEDSFEMSKARAYLLYVCHEIGISPKESIEFKESTEFSFLD